MMYEDGVGQQHDQPLPMLNYDLLEEAVSWAKWSAEHDVKDHSLGYYWDQGSWAGTDLYAEVVDEEQANECHTSFCIAGYAAMATGHTKMAKRCEFCGNFRDVEPEHRDLMPECDCTEKQRKRFGVEVEVGTINLHLIDPNLPERWSNGDWWSRAGRQLLGLTVAEADALFEGSNDIERVIEIANDICLSRGKLPLNLDRWEFKMIEKKVLDSGVVESSGYMVPKETTV